MFHVKQSPASLFNDDVAGETRCALLITPSSTHPGRWGEFTPSGMFHVKHIARVVDPGPPPPMEKPSIQAIF